MYGNLSQTELDFYLNCYHDSKESEVTLSKSQTKEAKKVSLEVLSRILGYIHAGDPRFTEGYIRVGSYWSNLKVGQPDEFDVGVALNIPKGAVCWIEQESSPTSAARFCNIRFENAGCYQRWRRSFDILDVRYFFIPRFVKHLYRDHLECAIRNLLFPGRTSVSVSPQAAGPALTITISHPHRTIHVDITPTLQFKVPFPSWIRWPRANKAWPPKDKVKKIQEIGINFTPKGGTQWNLSFAEAEKELIRNIDREGDNTNRKKLHRIMKKLTQDVWCPGQKPVLSSYILKNVLFWECEEYPRSQDWENPMIGRRFWSLTTRLLRALQQKWLGLYFDPDVNLLEGKDMVHVIGNITSFMNNPRGYLAPQSVQRPLSVGNTAMNVGERALLPWLNSKSTMASKSVQSSLSVGNTVMNAGESAMLRWLNSKGYGSNVPGITGNLRASPCNYFQSQASANTRIHEAFSVLGYRPTQQALNTNMVETACGPIRHTFDRQRRSPYQVLKKIVGASPCWVDCDL